MFYINLPFKSYHVILRQRTVLAAFRIQGVMCKWGGSPSESTVNELQDLQMLIQNMYKEKEEFVFQWLGLQQGPKGEVMVNQMVCSAPGAMLTRFQLA